MIIGRVLLSISLHKLNSFCSQRLNVVKELQVWKLHSLFNNSCNKVEKFTPPLHQFRLQVRKQDRSTIQYLNNHYVKKKKKSQFQVAVQSCVCSPALSVMQPASISYGGEANAVASDGKDEEERCTGGTETLVEVEREMRQDKMIITTQVDAISLEVHGSITDPEISSGLSK